MAQLIFFYSNDHAGLLADTGLPSGLYDNTVTIQESQSGPTIYTQLWDSRASLPIVPWETRSNIFSAPDTGSTLLMLGAAIAGLVFLRWKMLAV